MKRHHVLAAAGLLALTACAGQPAASSSAVTATPSATTTSTRTTEAPADPLEGTWTTEELSGDELKQANIDAGYSEAEAGLELIDLGDVPAASLQIRFLGGQASQFMTPAGGEGPIPQYDGPYRLLDDHTLVWTDGDCDTTVAFELDGDTLTFTNIVEDECPALDSKIAHITFLLSAPYTRAD